MSPNNKKTTLQPESLVTCCGHPPYAQVVGIALDEYDEIECMYCNQMVRRLVESTPPAADIWNQQMVAS